MGTTEPIVTAGSGGGLVRGVRAGAVTAFRGVPYAASPVGRLRLRPPAEHPGWSGVRDGSVPGPAVPQRRSRLENVMGPREPDWSEEDCLNLNIWTPTAAFDEGAEARRPVLLWLHGGGFSSGSGGWDWYDGARLAEAGGIVVVSANYRLGAFGYLWLPETGAGNLGCLDQAAALRWVHTHIDAFGGDPGRITVGGQSAGAYSALALALDPTTSGMVGQVLAQSGPWGMAPQPQQDADAAAARFLELLGLSRGHDPGPALRRLPAADLLSPYARLAADLARPGDLAPPLYPVLGGAGMPDAWPHALAQGRLAGKRVLLGRTEDEVSAFTGQMDAAATEEWFGAGVTEIARSCAERGDPAYVYRFARTSTSAPELGATHCADLPFAFDNLDAYQDAPMLGPVDDADRELARRLSGALAAFVASGDPGWPAHGAVDGHVAQFGALRTPG
jgi:para-nitrobenzyl esterase